MEAVKKYWLWGIFISILSIFAMSHNANAIEFTLSLDDYTLSRNLSANRLDITWNKTQTCINSQSCNVYFGTDYTHIQKIKTTTAYSAKANDIVIMRVLIANQSQNGSETSGSPFNQRSFDTANNSLIFIGHKIISVDNQNILSQLGYGPNANEFYTQLTTIYKNISVYEYYFKVLQDGNYNFGFESINYDAPARDIFVFPAYSTSSSVYISLTNLQQYSYIGDSANKEVEQKTQEAVDESESAGGDSSTSAQTGTTGLLNAITGAVSVISSAQPTNCKINGNMGNLDIGQLDLCANPAPAFVQTIGSLILILMCVPLAISLFNRFIAIFRSFQS